MNDGELNNQDAVGNEELLSLQDFSFSPDWARKSPSTSTHGKFHDDGEDRGHGPGGFRRDGDRDRDRRGQRPPAHNPLAGRPMPRPARLPDDGAPAPAADRPRRDFHDAPPRRDFRGPARDNRPPREFRRPEPPPPPLPVDIRLIPDTKGLASIVRRIVSTHRAFPLRDIARLFLDNPESCLVRVDRSKDSPEGLTFFQCSCCGMPSLSEDAVRAHILAEHFDEYFTVEDVEDEPPSGNFPSVARCGLSGELLGPPNHHSFATRVREMLRTRYPHMSEEDYRSRIEIVHEPEVIEQWREQARHRRVYRLKTKEAAKPAAPAEAAADAPAEAQEAKPAEDAPVARPLDRQGAEALFTREILPGLIRKGNHVIAPIPAMLKTPDKPLDIAVRNKLNDEDRFPATLFFALRGAFRHRDMHFFRAYDARGQEFVIARAPTTIDVEHAVPEVRLVIDYATAHKNCTRSELLAALSKDKSQGEIQKITAQLNMLVEKVHLIEYFNGVLALPAEHPTFKSLNQNRGNQKKPAPAPATEAAGTDKSPVPAAAETAAAETAAAEPAAIEAQAEAPAAPAPAEAPAETVAPEVPAPATAAPEAPAPEPAAEAPAPAVEPSPTAVETAPEAPSLAAESSSDSVPASEA